MLMVSMIIKSRRRKMLCVIILNKKEKKKGRGFSPPIANSAVVVAVGISVDVVLGILRTPGMG